VSKKPILLIGVGNVFRGDDAIGPWVASRIAEREPKNIDVLVHHGEGMDLMSRWEGYKLVVIVDAAKTGSAPLGAIHEIDAAAKPVPTEMLYYSSHAFGVAEAIETARDLGTLPPALTLYAIEGGLFTMGEQPTETVRQAGEALAERLLSALG
jgi:hydrogenase maturation protease